MEKEPWRDEVEGAIIQRARMGDQWAFQQLVEIYHDVAWRTARVLLSDRASAEDALQDAWVDVWRGLPGFLPTRPFRPWLLTIIANRCRMSVRRRSLPTIPVDEAQVDSLLSADDVLKHVLQLERTAELQAALSKLPADQQRVLGLRFFAGLELNEIALVMAVPVGTVKSRLHRALNALRTYFQVTSRVGG